MRLFYERFRGLSHAAGTKAVDLRLHRRAPTAGGIATPSVVTCLGSPTSVDGALGRATAAVVNSTLAGRPSWRPTLGSSARVPARWPTVSESPDQRSEVV